MVWLMLLTPGSAAVVLQSQEETTMSEAGTRNIPPLNWDVFVTPGIPIATNDTPPGTKQAMFQAIASTLIYGKRDAVLVDAFMTIKQTAALVDWVAASGKNLTTIYITHGH